MTQTASTSAQAIGWLPVSELNRKTDNTYLVLMRKPGDEPGYIDKAWFNNEDQTWYNDANKPVENRFFKVVAFAPWPTAESLRDDKTQKIINAIVQVVRRLGGMSDILGSIGSWKDTLPDEDVLNGIHAWLAASPAPTGHDDRSLREVEGGALPASLEAIAGQVQSWLDWSKRRRDAAHMETEDGTHIMTLPVPYWPNHGSLKRWVLVLNAARAALSKRAQASGHQDTPQQSGEPVGWRYDSKHVRDPIFQVSRWAKKPDFWNETPLYAHPRQESRTFEDGIEAAALACHEQRCERGTPWDLAVMACVGAIRALSTKPQESGSALSKEWCMNMARAEEGYEVGAGALDHPLRATSQPSQDAVERDPPLLDETALDQACDYIGVAKESVRGAQIRAGVEAYLASLPVHSGEPVGYLATTVGGDPTFIFPETYRAIKKARLSDGSLANPNYAPLRVYAHPPISAEQAEIQRLSSDLNAEQMHNTNLIESLKRVCEEQDAVWNEAVEACVAYIGGLPNCVIIEKDRNAFCGQLRSLKRPVKQETGEAK